MEGPGDSDGEDAFGSDAFEGSDWDENDDPPSKTHSVPAISIGETSSTKGTSGIRNRTRLRNVREGKAEKFLGEFELSEADRKVITCEDSGPWSSRARVEEQAPKQNELISHELEVAWMCHVAEAVEWYRHHQNNTIPDPPQPVQRRRSESSDVML